MSAYISNFFQFVCFQLSIVETTEPSIRDEMPHSN